MPIRKCSRNGKSGYQWGSQKCYTGPGARKKAERQAAAIRASGYTANAAASARLLAADPSRTNSLRRSMAGRAARPFLDLGSRLEEYLGSLPPMSDSDLVDSLEVWLEGQERVVLSAASAAVEQAARQGWERGAARAVADSKFVRRGGTALAVGAGLDVLTVNATAAEQGVISAVRSRLSVRENLKGILGWARRLVKRVWDETRNSVQQVVGDLLGRRLGIGRIIPAVRSVVRRQSRRAGKNAQDAIIKGHAEGQLDVYESVGVRVVIRKVEFTTSKDNKVCPTCRMLRGARLTLERARGVIPIHPNCRCVWVPVEFDEVEEVVRVPYRGPVRKLPRQEPTVNISGCGAGAPGSPGFQPGNTCAAGGKLFRGVDPGDPTQAGVLDQSKVFPEKDYNAFGPGVYLTPDLERAKKYGDVQEFRSQIQKPKRFQGGRQEYDLMVEQYARDNQIGDLAVARSRYNQFLYESGHDAIIAPTKRGDEVIVLDVSRLEKITPSTTNAQPRPDPAVLLSRFLSGLAR